MSKEKISWAWWHIPVIPATRETEAGELPEPGRWSCSEPRSRHCTPAWVTRAKLLKKKKKERKLRLKGMYITSTTVIIVDNPVPILTEIIFGKFLWEHRENLDIDKI